MNIPPIDTILKLLQTALPSGTGAPDLDPIDPRRLGYFLAIWIGLEILAFTLIVHSLGFLATLVLALATTMLGLADTRRLLLFWRRNGADVGRHGPLFDGGLSALGAFLLILPGFVSDFAGLALKSPSVRAALAQRFGKTGATCARAGDPSVIDLSPREYRNIDQPKRSARRTRGGSAG